MKTTLVLTALIILLFLLRYFNFKILFFNKRWLFRKNKWWRSKGCYIFKTCPRCLIPNNSNSICNTCKVECSMN